MSDNLTKPAILEDQGEVEETRENFPIDSLPIPS